MNTYAYGENSPLRFVDSLGLNAAEQAAAGVVTATGIGIFAAGANSGNLYVMAGGLVVMAIGGYWEIYATFHEGQDAGDAIDKAQSVVNKINEQQREQQRQLDQLFPPKNNGHDDPNCPSK